MSGAEKGKWGLNANGHWIYLGVTPWFWNYMLVMIAQLSECTKNPLNYICSKSFK